MNIVFFGSSEFAVESLNKLLLNKAYNILCVVTQPDKKQGRGLKLSHTLVKDAALKNKLNIYQPKTLRNPQVISYLNNLNADIFVVIAYGKILPEELLKIPKVFSINLHASLLPKYRGAAPINWAIINAENETGVSIIKMNPAMDAGEIISQQKIAIKNDDTSVTLEKKLAVLGSNLLLQALEAIANNKHQLIKQDGAKISLAPLMKKEDGLINWRLPAENLYNLIRGCLDWPGAFTHLKEKTIKVWAAIIDSKENADAQPGEIIRLSKEGILVKTGKGNLLIKELQPESGKRMAADVFLQGHKLKIGNKFI